MRCDVSVSAKGGRWGTGLRHLARETHGTPPVDQPAGGPLVGALGMTAFLGACAAAAAWIAARTRDPQLCYPSRCDDPYFGMSPTQRDETVVVVDGATGALHRVVDGRRVAIGDGVHRFVVLPARGGGGGISLRVDADGNAETHADLGAGQPALLAGYIEFVGGEPVAIDRNSGHYAPTREHLLATVAAMRAEGYLTDRTRVCAHGRGVQENGNHLTII